MLAGWSGLPRCTIRRAPSAARRGPFEEAVRRVLLPAMVAGLVVASLVAGSWAAAAHGVTTAPPPAPYARVSQLVPLPDFIPGVGTLFVDPSTLPVGPFLAYNRQGSLVALVFMVPLEDMNAHARWTDLAAAISWFPVQHVDLDYNPGHPGVEKPHYHIVLWAISHEEEQRSMR